MKMQYKRISLKTTNGFRLAESLQHEGWKVAQVGIDNILMMKKV